MVTTFSTPRGPSTYGDYSGKTLTTSSGANNFGALASIMASPESLFPPNTSLLVSPDYIAQQDICYTGAHQAGTTATQKKQLSLIVSAVSALTSNDDTTMPSPRREQQQPALIPRPAGKDTPQRFKCSQKAYITILVCFLHLFAATLVQVKTGQSEGLPPPPPLISNNGIKLSPAPQSNPTGAAGLRLNKFVRRLHEMLKAEKDSGIVEWRRGLLVLFSTDAFAKTILPKYFNTRNFKTFRRQVRGSTSVLKILLVVQQRLCFNRSNFLHFIIQSLIVELLWLCPRSLV
jgi:hypothetical protein